MDIGIRSALGSPVADPLPVAWLGRNDAPPTPPNWAKISKLSPIQQRNLQAQLAYSLSRWDYALVSANGVGRYQFSTQLLEDYGLLISGANRYYGTDCVNYVKAWQPKVLNNIVNAYQNYFYDTKTLPSFLASTVAQEHLAYQRIHDLYLELTNINAIAPADTSETVAGMISVAWTLGAGTPGGKDTVGTGAWAWRYFGKGNGINSFNAGRYAVAILSQ
jgi:hypothetical protein